MISVNLESKLTFSEFLEVFSMPLHHNSLSSSVNNELWELILQMSLPEGIVIIFGPLILPRLCLPYI